MGSLDWHFNGCIGCYISGYSIDTWPIHRLAMCGELIRVEHPPMSANILIVILLIGRSIFIWWNTCQLPVVYWSTARLLIYTIHCQSVNIHRYKWRYYQCIFYQIDWSFPGENLSRIFKDLWGSWWGSLWGSSSGSLKILAKIFKDPPGSSRILNFLARICKDLAKDLEGSWRILARSWQDLDKIFCKILKDLTKILKDLKSSC